MRDLTPAELHFVYDGYRCLFCGFSVLRPGPRGGIMQNVFCVRCGGGFNLVAREHLSAILPTIPPFGQVINCATIPDHERLPELGDVLEYYRRLHEGKKPN